MQSERDKGEELLAQDFFPPFPVRKWAYIND